MGEERTEKVRRMREYGLTAGTLGSSSAQTLMVVLLPFMLSEYTGSTTLIGLVVAAEGFFALTVPYIVGSVSDGLSDRIARRLGRRNAVMLLIAPVLAGALAIVPFLDGFWTTAAAAAVVFALLHAYRTPLWALMVDSVPERRWGRVEGVRGAFHAGGLGFGIVGGGLLYSIWRPLPFLVVAGLILVTTAVTYFATPDDSDEHDTRRGKGADDAAGAHASHGVIAILREKPALRWLLLAHALWTGAVDGIRPFIFMFATVVIGISIAESSLLLLVLLVGLATGSVVVGRVGDRVGPERALTVAALLMGSAMMLGVLIRDVPLAVALLVPVGVAGAAFISLPYPLFASFIGDEGMGKATGIFSGATGLAHFFAPIMVGAAIELGRPLFPEQQGLPLMWPIVGVFALLSVPLLRRAVKLNA